MKYRRLGKTEMEISEIALGTWQLGGKWGAGFDRDTAEKTLQAAADQDINFLDTADVYKEGESEAAVGEFVRHSPKKLFVATKCGRRLSPHTDEMYTVEALRGFVEDSLANSGMETLDLIQLHCPPTAVYYRPEIFELFDKLKDEGKIRHLGVSIEKVEEGIKALEYPNVCSLQVIFNPFRQRPSELLFPLAQSKDVGIIVRVPLASGLLTGKFSAETTFDEGDHRFFNREGKAFDKGETFAGIPYSTGLEAVAHLRKGFGEAADLAQLTLRWILGFEAVSCIIPGASQPEQVGLNAKVSGMPPLDDAEKKVFQETYQKFIRPHVHQLW